MTGPEHYREAERLLRNAQEEIEREIERGDPKRVSLALEVASNAAAVAQAHATLAAAAAAAYPAVRDYCGDEATDPRDWTRATS